MFWVVKSRESEESNTILWHLCHYSHVDCTKISTKFKNYVNNLDVIQSTIYNDYKCIVVDNKNKIKSIDERLNDDNIYSLSGFCAKYVKTNRERKVYQGSNWFSYKGIRLINL